MKRQTRFHVLVVLLLALGRVSAQEIPSGFDQAVIDVPAYGNSFGKLPADATSADRQVAQWLKQETRAIALKSMSDIKSRLDWEANRELYRRQLFEMLSLDPLPKKTDLKATVTGVIERDDFLVEKIHFQSRPGLYVTGNLYRPKKIERPLPAILYVCGHGQVKIDGLSYGNKVTYQHHGIWFARNGYVCFVIDSVQLGEIEGIHHGTHRMGMWWWNSRGYTSAGAEAWNCIRALDYLESRSDVDAERIGVTGRSGGGAYSWWIAALDDRIKVACPVAGITDLMTHVVDGCVQGHCDCMYMVNTYRWDYAQVAALVSPRPMLILNSDKDSIFPLSGVVRLHSQVRRIYDYLESSDKLGLIITEGPHKDSQELQLPVMRWFNKWLKKDDTPVTGFAEKLFEPAELKVFGELPSDEITSRCYEDFTELAVDLAPRSRDEVLEALKAKTFAAWPKDANDYPRITEVSTHEKHGVSLSVYQLDVQPSVTLRFFAAQSDEVPASRIDLRVLDQAGWDDVIATVGSGFAESLDEELKDLSQRKSKGTPADRGQTFRSWASHIANDGRLQVYFAPRAIGLSRWSEDEKYRVHLRRRFMLVGTTLASMQAWDVKQIIESLHSWKSVPKGPIHVRADTDMTEVASFAALFSPPIATLKLAIAPRADKEAADFLNWSRIVTAESLTELLRGSTTLVEQELSR